ncbi:lipopolysaccharide biosynthesis protein [Methylobacterium nigriterrae]|uniref:lipopolysaccharide biosynthesis protein n=1 Tax=Methylobacterium nigriterrae TaxID=3127512 RepID=UPI0030139B9E
MQAKAKKAHFWLVMDVLGSQGIPFVVFLVIARIIGPDYYGEFTLAMACVGLMNVVIFQGIADALIRVPDLDERHVSTAFWMNLALAFLTVLLAQVTADGLATFFHAPDMEGVIRWLSLLGPLQALISVQVVLSRRNLDTSILARRTFLGRSIGGAAGIGLALAGAGIWSLVVLQLLQALISVWVLWRADPWRPRRVFDLAHARTLARFGSHFMGGSLITALGACVDRLLVGFFFDPTTVGCYALAARLIEMARVLVLTPMRFMIMPVLSRLANPHEFSLSYDTMVRSALVVWMPVVLALGLNAAILPTVFGDKWQGSVVVLQAMSLAAFTMPVWAFVGESLSAVGRPDLYLRFAAGQVGIVAVCVVIGAQFGLTGVGLAWSAGSACMVPLALLTLRKVCGFDWEMQVATTTRIALAGLGFVACVLAVDHLAVARPWPALASTVLATGCGLCVYLALIEFVLVPGYVSRALRDLKGIVLPDGRGAERAAGTSR